MKPGGSWPLTAALLLLVASAAGGALWLRERRAWLRPPGGRPSVCIRVEEGTEKDLIRIRLLVCMAIHRSALTPNPLWWEEVTERPSTPIRPGYLQYGFAPQVHPVALWERYVPHLEDEFAAAPGAPRCKVAVVDARGNLVGSDR
jgi:hypothetical protein